MNSDRQPQNPFDPPAEPEAPFEYKIAAESFRLMVEATRDYGIFMLDPQGHILTWNLGAQRIKGYTAREAIGRHFSIFYTEPDRVSHYPQKELEIAEREGRYEEEGWRVRKNGTRFWANIVITKLVDGSGKTVGFGKVTRDLSERKRNEELLRMANETLERRVAERTSELSVANEKLHEAVEARDNFLSIASHELRTPITPLKIQVQLLNKLLLSANKDFDYDRLKRMAGTIDRSLTRIEKLIENLLDVSRLNSGRMQLHPEDLDLAEVVRETVARQRAEAIQAGSELELEVPNSLPAHMDRLRFEQVFLNFLTNAIKYGRKKPIRISLSVVDEQIVLSVRDQGIGVDTADHERMFYRFERISNSQGAEGLGLGLFIAKQIVDMHGGRIKIESKLGQGSKFTIYFPYVPAQKNP